MNKQNKTVADGETGGGVVMIQAGVTTVKRGGLFWLVRDGRRVKFHAWSGGLFAGLYDRIMQYRVFPKLFSADYARHAVILKQMYAPIRLQSVLELGTGSGSAAGMLVPDNRYTGVDVSPRLLRRAAVRFEAFTKAELYVVSADCLPFDNRIFDACICALSLNFFPEPNKAIAEAARVLKPGGRFYGCVPIASRAARAVHGTQFEPSRLKLLFGRHGFDFTQVATNGALLYFTATRKS